MIGRNYIKFSRVQAANTTTGSKDELVELFSTYADISVYSAKMLQKFNLDTKQNIYTIKIRYSSSRILKVGDRIDTKEGQLTVQSWQNDTMGKNKFIIITASRNGI